MSDLPKGWTEVALGEVAEQVRGVSYKKDQAATSPGPSRIPILRAGNLRDGGQVDDSDLVWVPDICVSERQRLRPGDVIVATSSGSLDVVGKAARYKGTRDLSFGAFCKVMRPASGVDASYFAHYFQTSAYRRTVSALAAGANINNLKNSHLDELRFPLPPLEEQRRIAAILDKADELRAKRRSALEQLDLLTQAIFLGVQANHPDTPCVTIESIAARERGSIRTGPFGSQLLHSEFVNEGVRVLGIDNVVANEFRWAEPRYITHEKYETLRRFAVHPGDVLVTIMGTCGRAAVVPDDVPVAINTKHLCCITVDRAVAEPRWLHAALLHDRMTRRQLGERAKGAVMPGLNMGVIKSTEVPIPRLVVQQEFVAQLEAIDRLKLRSAATGLGGAALFASLQARAFRGEL